MALRFDSIQLRAPHFDMSGFLHVDASLTRSGVFPYKRSDGSVYYELRHPDDVLKADSVESAKRRPVVDGHPVKDGQFILVTPQNAKEYIVGFSGDNVTIAYGEILGTLTITDGAMIQQIKDGKREISMGYSADIIHEAGEYQGQKYDTRQTNVVYNHVAVLDKARVRGSRIRMDAADAVACDNEKNMYGEDINPKGTKMASKKISLKKISIGTVRRDAEDVEVPEDAVPQVEKSEATLADVVKMCEDLQARVSELEGKLTATEAAKADTEAKLVEATDPKVIEEKSKERADLLDVAKTVGVEKTDGLSTADLKKAIVSKHAPSIKVDGMNADAVNGAYAVVAQGIQKRADGAASVAALRMLTSPAGLKDTKTDGALGPSQDEIYFAGLAGKKIGVK